MNIFSFIKSHISIADIVGEYTTLKSAGFYLKGNCPFHSEKTASFTVSPHKEIFYCFGCHATGDVIAFIAKIENYSQMEAAKFLIEKYGLQVPKEISNELILSEKSIDEKNKYFKLCEVFANWCSENLLNDNKVKKYVQERGINKNSIEKFSIGYFPSGPLAIKSLSKFAGKFGVILQDFVNVNLIVENQGKTYSPFEERIIFPIRDQLGNFCGFGGRIFKENDERAKYYNSHENIHFNKGQILFGLDLAKKDIQSKNFAFLVEGYIDCIMMSQYGFGNTIASLGTACTIDHLKQLGRFTQELYVLYDGDSAGQKAILRLTELCWNVNLNLKVVTLPEKEDPASYLKNGGDLVNLVNNARDIYTFFIESSTNAFFNKTLQEKLSILKKLISIIYNIEDSLKRNVLLQEMTIKLDIPIDLLTKELNNKTYQQPIKKINVAENKLEKIEIIRISVLEERIISMIINNFDLFESKLYWITKYFAFPAKEILEKLIELKQNNGKVDVDLLINNLNEEQNKFINRVVLENNLTNNDANAQDEFDQLILQFNKKNWKNLANTIKFQLAQAQQQKGNNKEVQKIIADFQELKNKMLLFNRDDQ